MGAGVVSVGRRFYAVGLYWENSPSGRVAQAAKEAASQPGQQADLYAVRGAGKTERVPQFGLGQFSAGHKAGMPVFAGCLANQQGGSWVGAFRLREGTVVTVVRDDLIVPDGDQFYLNESDARDRLLQEIGFGGLQRIYAPEAWAIPGADSMPLSLLLDERRDVRLQGVRISKQTIVLGAVLAALLLIGISVAWYIQAQEDAEEKAAHDALQKAQSAAQKLLPTQLQSQKIDYPPPERKWEKRAPPLDVIENCRAGLAKVPFEVNGWKMNQLTCEGNSINVTWQRTDGMTRPPPTASVIDAATSASASYSLPAVNPRGPQDLSDPNEITRRYLAQNWPGTIGRLPDDPPPPPPPNFTGNWNPPPPPWVKRSFTLTVSELPGSLRTFFQDLPGAVVNSLSYAPGSGGGGGLWRIEGVIYENRI